MSLADDRRAARRWPGRGWPAWLAAGPAISTEALALCAGLFFALACNGRFLDGAMAGRDWADARTWVFGAAMVALLSAVHAFLLGLVLHVRIARALLALLLVVSALATYYMQRYGVFLDPAMLRAVLHTGPAEAGELLGWDLLLHLGLFAGLPIALLWWVRLPSRPIGRALAIRVVALVGTAGLALASLLLVFQDFSSLIRNHRELRYLITPANVVYSTARAFAGDARGAKPVRAEVGTDARLGPAWSARSKPALFVIVLGETARAANWGLNGLCAPDHARAGRARRAELRRRDRVRHDTETSLPCMFSAIGRRHYDEDRIRGSESLLHVLARAGFGVLWRDNQSGCKGVCAGLPHERLSDLQIPGLCDGGRCLDDVLLRGLDSVARDAKGNLVVVLHTLGNHGPAYYRRYPPALRRYAPSCDTDELRKCSTEQIVNAYDNALLYTDDLLARVIGFLGEQGARFDTAMLYVSDHGESLGEAGLFLHGLPHAIAPADQLKVPMVWWLSPGFTSSFGLDRGCLQAQTGKPWAHDHLFHTVLGLLQVDTGVYEPALDIGAACRG